MQDNFHFHEQNKISQRRNEYTINYVELFLSRWIYDDAQLSQYRLPIHCKRFCNEVSELALDFIETSFDSSVYCVCDSCQRKRIGQPLGGCHRLVGIFERSNACTLLAYERLIGNFTKNVHFSSKASVTLNSN